MKQPEITFRHGPMSAMVFEETHEKNGRRFTCRRVQLVRRVQTESGEWITTDAMRINDIPKATLVLNKAYEFMTSTGATDEE